jgi:hypothetical protein
LSDVLKRILNIANNDWGNTKWTEKYRVKIVNIIL